MGTPLFTVENFRWSFPILLYNENSAVSRCLVFSGKSAELKLEKPPAPVVPKTKTKTWQSTCSSGPPKSPPHSVVVKVLRASNTGNLQLNLFCKTSFSDQLQCLTYLQILPDWPQSSTSATSFSPNSSFRYPDKKCSRCKIFVMISFVSRHCKNW